MVLLWLAHRPEAIAPHEVFREFQNGEYRRGERCNQKRQWHIEEHELPRFEGKIGRLLAAQFIDRWGKERLLQTSACERAMRFHN